MPFSRTAISSPDAPAAIGPYSQAIASRGLLFCSGQVPLDPRSGEIVGATAAEQARQALANLEAVCAAADARLGDAVKCTVYLADMAAFAEVNEVYAEFFGGEPPARVALAVAGLPRGALVEIDAIVPLP
ncbi:MAG TPA: Rid family detoxifying hydrolase [Solirubrobacteraceae bacterium]|jgi:2-iminobutanoate/2-iminopropanoate deaminase|nr:Rid family detoxifying hydrolase [Solirubrobacteraceae bacterium]